MSEYFEFRKTETFWVKIFVSGPIEIAKQIIREDCFAEGLCVTVEPTTFIYTGGEESGYVVGLINYPRFPSTPQDLENRAIELAIKLRDRTFQHSCLVMTPSKTTWFTTREQNSHMK